MDRRDRIRRMREAATEGRVALGRLRDALTATSRDLEHERAEPAAAERRGRLARDIGDAETVEVAGRYAARHAERVAVLERKLEAQRAEQDLLEREVADMVAELKRLELGVDAPPPGRPAGAEAEDLKLRQELDQAAREAAADQALRELKKRMGR